MTSKQADKTQRLVAIQKSILRWLATILGVSLCFCVRILFQPFLEARAAFAPFYVAVLIAAWLGGWRLGIFSIVLSIVVADYFFITPTQPQGLRDSREALPIVLFVVIGLCICGIGNALRRRAMDLEASENRYRLLSDEVGARAERESLINRIGAAVRSHENPDEIQRVASHELGKALGADRCYLAVYDLRAGAIVVGHDWHREDLTAVRGEYVFENTAEMFKEFYKGSTTSVVRDCYDSDLSPATIANMEQLQLRSRLSIALADSEGTMATLTAAMCEQPREWTQSEISLLESVATLLKSALESARVKVREHRIATELQQALQPPNPRSLPGLTIGSFMDAALDEAAIGGDFFDIFPLDKQNYALVVGDVSGKGLAAAAQVATIRNMLRAFLYDHRDPASASSKLNGIVIANELLVGFVTVIAGIYDVGSGDLTYVSCGHEPALLRRASTKAIETLSTAGPPIGASDTATYDNDVIHLDPGDTLLLYTDGISESGPNRVELLGIDGLTKLFSRSPVGLTPDQEAIWLVNQAGASNQGEFRDDVCVVIMRRATS